MVVHEGRAEADRRVGKRERKGGVAREELVAHGSPDVVQALAVDHFPVPASHRIDAPLGLGLARERSLLRHECTAVRVVRPPRHADGVDLDDRVVLAVDVEVEAGAEDVLVVGRQQAGGDLGRVAGLDAGSDASVSTMPVSFASNSIDPS